MKNFDTLYEGVLDKLGKTIGGKLRGAGEVAAKGVEKTAKGAEKLAAKTPFLGSISKANKAVAKIEKYFRDVVQDMNNNREMLAKLKGKADALLNKLIDVFGDNPDKEVLQIMRKIEDRSKAIQDMFKDLSTVAGKAKAGAENEDYKKVAPEDKPENTFNLKKQVAPEDKPENTFNLKKQVPQFNSKKYDNEQAINEAVSFIDITCDEIEKILEDLK